MTSDVSLAKRRLALAADEQAVELHVPAASGLSGGMSMEGVVEFDDVVIHDADSADTLAWQANGVRATTPGVRAYE